MISLTTFKRLLHIKAAASFMILGLWFVLGVSNVQAQAITEDFVAITTLPAAGWFTQNNSIPVGSTGWFQGNTAVFPAQAGAATSYIGANFNNTTGTNTISNWLLTPNRTFNNGDIIKFWTRGPAKSPFPDRMQVRLSTAGASTNVGTGAGGIGDFTTILQDINPTLAVGGYPEVWTEFTITLSGLAGPTSGRVGFRYFVAMGGPTGDNSNFIGIDTFSYTPGGAVPAADQVLDYNDDGKTDFVTVRNTGGGPGGQITWFIGLNGVAGPLQGFEWGIATDEFISGDFDADGKDDVAVFRANGGVGAGTTFYILNSNGNTARVENFGITGDDPSVVGDYNNDGADDVAVYRGGAAAGDQSTWFFRTTPNGAVSYVPHGQNGDFPAPGDYDGDGSFDFVVQRNAGGGQAAFWRNLTTAPDDIVIFGTPTDVIVPGDYDGDGKTDIAVVRGSAGQILWYYEPSGTAGVQALGALWGTSASDFVAQGDYDGDGRTDFAVWRPSVTPGQSAFWISSAASGAVTTVPFGQNGEYPVANYNSH